MVKQLTEEIVAALKDIGVDIDNLGNKHIVYITILKRLEEGFEHPGV